MNFSLNDLLILYESDDYVEKILEHLDKQKIKYKIMGSCSEIFYFELIDYHYTIAFFKYNGEIVTCRSERAFEILVENSLLEKLNEIEINRYLTPIKYYKPISMLGHGLLHTTNLDDYKYRNLNEAYNKLMENNRRENNELN